MKKGYVYIALSTFLFSSMEIALKTVGPSFNPIQLSMTRFLIGGIVLLPFALKALKEKSISLNLSDLKYFSFLGFMCVVISMTFYQLAVSTSKASVVAVLFSCNPVFVMFFAYILLRENIHKNNVISLILEIIGILVIINPLHTNLNISGVLLTLLSAITFAIYGVLGKKKCIKFGGLAVTCFSFVFGSLEMIILSLLTKFDVISNLLNSNGLGIFSNIPFFTGYTLSNIFYVIYIFVFVTGIGYAFYFKAMEETSANTASLVFFFKPVLSPILAFLLIHEHIPFNMVIGIIFIILGSISSLFPSIFNNKHKNDNKALEES